MTVSELFDPSAWREVPGFDFVDITYHRAVDSGTVRIAFDRPEVRNGLNAPMRRELVAAIARAGSEARALVLTGAGRAFCSGQDLAEARALGLGVMAGCMVATSLAMAPALLIAQGAEVVDLDGPLLLARDRSPGLEIQGSAILPPPPELWG